MEDIRQTAGRQAASAFYNLFILSVSNIQQQEVLQKRSVSRLKRGFAVVEV